MRTLRRVPRGWRLLLALGAGAALFGVATMVQAAIPDESGLIHACYTKSGTLRVVDNSATDCRSTEKPLTWNQQGEKGDTGGQGPTGDTGPTGTGVRTVAGWVSSTGSVLRGSGFTASHGATGMYKLNFPAATGFTGGGGPCPVFPVLTVTPAEGVSASASIAYRTCTVADEGPIAGIMILFESLGSTPTPIDTGFWFIAAQP